MAYVLGIDIGTTYTGAAVGRDGRYDVVSLGNRAPIVPSVLLLRDDGTMLVGDAAARRAAVEPERVAREFKRRLGDPAPVIVGGTPYSADALMGRMLRWVFDQVTELEGGPPAAVGVTHPANWGAYKLELLDQAIRIAGLVDVTTISEPEAAAIHYASQTRIEPGSVIAVYDLGGGTFDAAVLRKTPTGWQLLGTPEGIERLGGVDFDAAVFHHVSQALGGALDELDPADATAQAAVARLRNDCVDAKEALSADTDTSIPVMLPSLQTEVRLTRAEYEQLVRPALADSITATTRALRSAGVSPDDVTAVLLVGGSSRTPLVAEMVSSALGRPVAVDAHPKHGVALGAAIAVASALAGVEADAAAGAPSVVAPVVAPVVPPVSTPAPPTEPVWPEPEPQPTAVASAGPPGPTEQETTSSRRPLLLAVGGVVAAALVAIVAASLLGGDDDGDPAVAADTTDGAEEATTTTAPATTTTAPVTTTTLPAGPFVQISDVVLDGDLYRVNYAVTGFTPLVNGGSDSLHVHFFLDTTAPENAGTNGAPPGIWNLTDETATFLTEFGPANRGDATQMCSGVATVDHAVHQRGTRTGNCVDLPA
jgi:actin-like ATPase involved in cell morphogenesis